MGDPIPGPEPEPKPIPLPHEPPNPIPGPNQIPPVKEPPPDQLPDETPLPNPDEVPGTETRLIDARKVTSSLALHQIETKSSAAHMPRSQAAHHVTCFAATARILVAL
ncbi:hypothetical protein B5P45_18680 [Phyllobacterium zundukense]|uniref:Uncharacterized protein n=1 Tax=Phyllobacterium zundukense TaxID=1867719 RepID=A0A2N9VV31_9HYPH|nr:hypothetical protein BLM14_24845 [Phyllobacterium zundukense]PIO43349.1 hypothetical protein B5P45_18680 [Phyllobacterium zundukense]